MKHFLFLSIFVFQSWNLLRAQENETAKDKIRFACDLSMSAIPMRLSGILDVSNGNVTMINGKEVPSNPEYKFEHKNALILSTALHANGHFPVVKKENWSFGVKVGAGVGLWAGVINAAGINALSFEFPQYIYFRNTKIRDLTAMVGYKYCLTALPSNLVLLAIEERFDTIGIRIFGSLNRQTYYTWFSDGTMEPSIRFGEYGVVAVWYF